MNKKYNSHRHLSNNQQQNHINQQSDNVLISKTRKSKKSNSRKKR